ncbi:MAG: pyridoxamine 5'-phosphate oxidase family protein [Anaerolineales bacterium]|nr:pyridoxamine 5'-phosphate oxidase family protein [Anaerolineales bacterium]
MTATDFPKTDQNRIRRLAKRGAYDRETIYPIVDAAQVCHVAFVHEGQPVVIPTIHAREDDTIYLHGAPASRLLKVVAAGAPLCVAVTHLDGLVVARSLFNSSMNYRSAVLFGHGRLLETSEEKLHALEVISEHLLPGRWAEARPTTTTELNATAVVAIEIETGSAKVRTGGPVDDEEDYSLPIWAGVIPLQVHALTPEPDSRLAPGIPVPDYLLGR